MLTDKMDMILNYDTIDLTQPAENVKAEIIARKLAYNTLSSFLGETIVRTEIKKIKNPYA